MDITENNPPCSAIPEIPEGEFRPLWSVIVPVYNCAEYLKHCLASVLQQDPGSERMEIMVIDDHSTQDDPESVVKAMGMGRIRYLRQPVNVGKSNNYATGLKLSKGKYIHLLHGDDAVNTGFYQKMEQLFSSFPEASAAFCQCNYINGKSEIFRTTGNLANDDGILPDFQETVSTWQQIQPPSVVFKREVYEKLGGYDNRLKYMEDWEFYVRASLHYVFAYTPEVYADYRVFPGNSSSLSIKGGARIKTLIQVLEIVNAYLPVELRAKIQNKQKYAASVYLVNMIPSLVSSRDLKGFLIVSRTFFVFNKNIRLLGRWLRFVFQYRKYLLK